MNYNLKNIKNSIDNEKIDIDDDFLHLEFDVNP